MKIRLTRLQSAVCLSVLSLTVWWETGGAVSSCNYSIVQALQQGDVDKAHELLKKPHNWSGILARLDEIGDKRLYNRALDAVLTQMQSPGIESEDGGAAYIVDTTEMDAVRLLSERGAIPTLKHLTAALDTDNTVVALYLLEHGAPMHEKGGRNLLTAAILNGNTQLSQALIARGANVNAPDRGAQWAGGWRPLDAAAWMGKTAIAKDLLDHGADPMLSHKIDTLPEEPIWEFIRGEAHETDAGGKINPDAVAIWRMVKPIAEKRLGRAVAD